jgi:hypothetical protein
MKARQSSASDLGKAFVSALAERNFGRLVRTLAPDVRLRALIPPGPIELSGANPVAAKFAAWFGEADGLELVRSGSDEIGELLHLFYRLRVKRSGDPWKLVEQHLFCALENGRFAAIDLVCSGLHPDVEPQTRQVATAALAGAAQDDFERGSAARAGRHPEAAADRRCPGADVAQALPARLGLLVDPAAVVGDADDTLAVA